MDSTAKPIAIVQGADSATVQGLFADCARRWSTHAHVVGVIEEARGELCTIGGAGRYSLFQELGADAIGCGLDATGVVQACADICRVIELGCDIVILSKFGRLEAEDRTGLLSAFGAAIEADIPILTAVAPRYADAWARFADPLFAVLPPEAAALDRWWYKVRRDRALPAS